MTVDEVIHIVNCTLVPVTVRHMDECYHELSVTHKNVSLFLTPKSRVLVKTGTVRECNVLIPHMFKLYNNWYTLTPKPVETIQPQGIQPLTKPSWKYMDAKNLMTSGIYSQQDLENLRDHIMFPAENPGLLNAIARTPDITSHQTQSHFTICWEKEI